MTTPGLVSWINRRQWRLQNPNMVQLAFGKIITSTCRGYDQEIGDSTAMAGGTVRFKYTQGEVMNAQNIRGYGSGASDSTAEENNSEVMTEGSSSPDNCRRNLKIVTNCDPDGRSPIYIQGRPILKALCEFLFWVSAEVSEERQQRDSITFSNRSAERIYPLDSMETRQSWRQAEKQQTAGVENRK